MPKKYQFLLLTFALLSHALPAYANPYSKPEPKSAPDDPVIYQGFYAEPPRPTQDYTTSLLDAAKAVEELNNAAQMSPSHASCQPVPNFDVPTFGQLMQFYSEACQPSQRPGTPWIQKKIEKTIAALHSIDRSRFQVSCELQCIPNGLCIRRPSEDQIFIELDAASCTPWQGNFKWVSPGYDLVHRGTVAISSLAPTANFDAQKLITREEAAGMSKREAVLSRVENRPKQGCIIPRPIAQRQCDTQLVVVEKYYEGTLKDVVSSQNIPSVVSDLFCAVQSLHDQNMVHRDIKPDNFLIDKNGNAVISDFGLALGAETQPSIVSTATSNMNLISGLPLQYFTQPHEYFKNSDAVREDLKKLDLMNLGATLYYLTHHQTKDPMSKSWEDFIRQKTSNAEIPKEYKSEYKNLLKKIRKNNPNLGTPYISAFMHKIKSEAAMHPPIVDKHKVALAELLLTIQREKMRSLYQQWITSEKVRQEMAKENPDFTLKKTVELLNPDYISK